MTQKQTLSTGIIVSMVIAAAAYWLNSMIPNDFLGATLLSLLIGMALNPLLGDKKSLSAGVNWSGKKALRIGIILAGVSLSFTQVLHAGKYAIMLLVFTLITAFGVGYICKRLFHINWKLASLLSISTAICGGTAVATLGPTIHAKDRDIAYAISATFLFDIITVIAFPWIGHLIGLSDTSYGLWIGTAVNDTSSVVAAGYAFSEAAGILATITKLTRTLFIVPIILIFSWYYAKHERQENEDEHVHIKKIFPWFILGFLAMAAVRTTGLLPDNVISYLTFASKFFLSTALAAIGLKTSMKDVTEVGIMPMVAGVIIDTSVVIVALFAQALILHYF